MQTEKSDNDLKTIKINVNEYRSGNKKETIQRNWIGYTKRRKENTTQYVFDTTMRKRTQITYIRHQPS